MLIMKSGKLSDISIDAGSSIVISVTFDNPFSAVPVVSIHCEGSGYQMGVTFKRTTVSGFEAWIKNETSNALTARSIGWNAVGKT